MQLVAVSRAAIGLRAQPAYIELGRYTAFVGPNDAGKSLWLASIEHALTGVPYENDEPRPGAMAVVVVTLNGLDELDAATMTTRMRSPKVTVGDEPVVWARSFETLDLLCRDAVEPALQVETTTQWLAYLEARMDDLGRRLLAIATREPTMITASTDDGWVDVSWLAVDAEDPDVQAIDEELRSRTGEGLANPMMHSTRPPTNPTRVPLAALPLLAPLRRSAFVLMRPDADLRRLRARIDAGAVIEGSAFAARVTRCMPPLLAERYRLSVSDRINEPASVCIQHVVETDRDPSDFSFDVEDLARGWWLWLAVAVELAHLELTVADLDDDDVEPVGVLMLDEPEQNLHANAQRAMSRWLAELSDRLMVIVATHSVAFTDPVGTRSTIGVAPSSARIPTLSVCRHSPLAVA
jgi:hypothetical protein